MGFGPAHKGREKVGRLFCYGTLYVFFINQTLNLEL